MVYMKDICINKKNNIWMDYGENHIFYITNLLDMLPTEIADNIWQEYWRYMFAHKVLKIHKVYEKYLDGQFNIKLTLKKEQWDYEPGWFTETYECRCLNKKGYKCKHSYQNQMYGGRCLTIKTREPLCINRLGKFRRMSPLSRGFIFKFEPKVCGVHSKRFNIKEYLYDNGYYVNKYGYLCRIRKSRHWKNIEWGDFLIE